MSYVTIKGLDYYRHTGGGYKDYWVGDATTNTWEFRESKKYTTDEFASDFMEMLDVRQEMIGIKI